MSIDEADPRLTAYVFGELSDEDKAALEVELSNDAAAREKLNEIRRTLGAIEAEFSETKPAQLEAERRQKIAAVLDEARRRKRRRLLWGGSVVTGMAASLLLLLTAVRSEREPVVKYAEAPILAPTDTVSETAVVPVSPAEPLPPAPDQPEIAPLTHGYLAVRRVSPASAERPPPAAQAQPAPEVAHAPVASVSAGEWDDNANYREFMRWLATEPAPNAHRIDIRDRRFIVVRDAAGLGVPNCRVTIEDENDRRTELVTSSAGRALLFPHAEGLGGRTLTATTDCAGAARKRFTLSGPDGVVDLHTSEQRALPAERLIDVAFILDSTGSMAEEIAAVKTTIQKVASSLRNSNVRIRIGLVEFKDRGDPFVTRIYPMSTDLERFSAQVASVQATGGGDTPESGNEALHVGIEQLAWSEAALARLAFLVGDAPPHLDYPRDYDYALEARTAARRGIQIYTVAASGMDTLGQVVWRQVAQYTGATNLFVLRGGAGPQSVGAGDPKSSCGGTQTAYTSGNLDALVLAKINGAIRALERDPMRIAGLNTDENAKPCADRILMAQ